MAVCWDWWITGLAVNHDDASVIESFIRRGADVDGYDRDGNTPLLRAGYSLKEACMHKRVYSSHNRSLSLTRCSHRRQISPPMSPSLRTRPNSLTLSDVLLVPPPRELDETYTSYHSAYSLYYVKTWRHPRNRKYKTYCIAATGRPNHGHRYRVIRTCCFWDMRKERETNIHIDIMTAILDSHIGGGVK